MPVRSAFVKDLAELLRLYECDVNKLWHVRRRHLWRVRLELDVPTMTGEKSDMKRTPALAGDQAPGS